MPNSFNVRHRLVLLGLVFFLSFFLRSAAFHGSDHQDYVDWTNWFVSHGIANGFEAPRFDYGPSVMYLLTGFYWLIGGKMAEFHIFLLQYYFLFDLATIFLMMWYLERSGTSAVRALFVLFNLAFIYNSLIWGQVDGIFTGIVFAALLAGLVGRPELVAVLFVVAFNLKPQPIIYLPLVGLLMIPCFVWQPRRLLTTLAAAAGTQLVLLIPFLANGAWRDWIDTYLQNLRNFPVASMRALNLWYLVLASDPTQIADATKFLALTYKRWGILLFGVYGFLALLPIVVRVTLCSLLRTRYTAKDGELVLLGAGVITLGFFFFSTEMHERYSFPAVLFLGAYAMLAHDYFLYILVSFAHLLNIILFFNLLGMSILLLNRHITPGMVAALFLVAVVVGLLQLYRGRALTKEIRKIALAFQMGRARTAPPVPAIP